MSTTEIKNKDESIASYSNYPAGLLSEFTHLPKVGVQTATFWQKNGCSDWYSLLDYLKKSIANQTQLFNVQTKSLSRLRLNALEESIQAYERKDLAYLSTVLPRRELWRLVAAIPEKSVFLDIETTGLSKEYNDITVIGINQNGKYRFFFAHREKDVEDFKSFIANTSLIITFNGSMFDLPFLRAKFPGIEIPKAHVDLRFLLRRVDLRGPQKKIEKELGLHRNSKFEDVAGADAVVLWSEYRRGNYESLVDLLKYNCYDLHNMRLLFNEFLNRVFADGSKKNSELFPETTFPEFSHCTKMHLMVGDKKFSIPRPPEITAKIDLPELIARMNKIHSNQKHRIIGIDLTGSEKRKSGLALLAGQKCKTWLSGSDEEIIETVLQTEPTLISIDSPLSFPKGRKSPSDDSPCRKEYGISRECERELKRRGISVFWCLLPTMQGLTTRGMKLAKYFEEQGIDVIESFPGAAQDILQIPRKKRSTDELQQRLIELGIRGKIEKDKPSHDELDAITSALVGYFYLADLYEPMGIEEENYLIVPRVNNISRR